MQKTYWWRILVLFISGGVVFLGWVYDTYLCFSSSSSDCPFDQFRLSIFEPAMFLSLLATSPFLFFVRDAVFLKWLRFAIVWFVITVLLIVLAPVSTGGRMSFGPTKEFVSMWMGALFVIASLAKLVWDSKKA
jgi:hypothetical protein